MDIDTSNKPTSPSSNRLLPIGLALAWVVLFAATFADLLPRWMQWDSSLAHGIPVVLIFFYLLWQTGAWQRQTLLPPLLELWLSVAALLVSSLLWFLAYAVNIQILEQLLLLPILTLAYATAFGWKTVLRHRFLLLFLIFAIPIWGSLNDVLLEAASQVVGQLVRWVEMPALIQGNSIYIPYGHILIADGCSGLRYFVIALTLAYLIGYLNGYSEGKFLVILVVAAILGLITNWIRIFILIVIGYKSQMESSLMADHELFGWILFGVIFLPAIYFAPVARRSAESSTISDAPIKRRSVGMALAAMAAGPLFGIVLLATFDPTIGKPVEVADLTRTESQAMLPVKVLAPEGGETSIQVLPGRVFWRQDVYHREELDEKLVPYIPRLYDHEHWMSSVDHLEGIGAQNVRYQELVKKGGDGRVAQIQWFMVGEHPTASSVQAKLWQIPATLRGRNDFAIVTMQARCVSESCSMAKTKLIEQAEKQIDNNNQNYMKSETLDVLKQNKK